MPHFARALTQNPISHFRPAAHSSMHNITQHYYVRVRAMRSHLLRCVRDGKQRRRVNKNKLNVEIAGKANISNEL